MTTLCWFVLLFSFFFCHNYFTSSKSRFRKLKQYTRVRKFWHQYCVTSFDPACPIDWAKRFIIANSYSYTHGRWISPVECRVFLVLMLGTGNCTTRRALDTYLIKENYCLMIGVNGWVDVDEWVLITGDTWADVPIVAPDPVFIGHYWGW